MKDIGSLVMLLKYKEDCIKLMESNVRYINIDIVNPDKDVIEYLLNSDNSYFIGDYIPNKYGYVYVDMDKFREGQNIINGILLSIDNSYNKLEMAKYLYIKLCKLVNLDINVMSDKCDIYNFSLVNNINNIWGSISCGRVSNVSITKLYLFLCSLMGIECEIVSNNDYGYLVNKLNIDGKILMVDITRDMAFVQAGFRTRYFDNYNDDIDLDKRIGYITLEYNDVLIDKVVKSINYSNNNYIYSILIMTSNIMDISNIGPHELDIVYQYIFDKYCSNYNVSVNNLYVNSSNGREHFILISYNNQHYSYNYNLNSFVKINNRDLIDNLNNNNIGIYMDEDIVINGYETVEEF